MESILSVVFLSRGSMSVDFVLSCNKNTKQTSKKTKETNNNTHTHTNTHTNKQNKEKYKKEENNQKVMGQLGVSENRRTRKREMK
jgi:hypothetical protein